jgi:hypothetical protein
MAATYICGGCGVWQRRSMGQQIVACLNPACGETFTTIAKSEMTEQQRKAYEDERQRIASGGWEGGTQARRDERHRDASAALVKAQLDREAKAKSALGGGPGAIRQGPTDAKTTNEGNRLWA